AFAGNNVDLARENDSLVEGPATFRISAGDRCRDRPNPDCLRSPAKGGCSIWRIRIRVARANRSRDHINRDGMAESRQNSGACLVGEISWHRKSGVGPEPMERGHWNMGARLAPPRRRVARKKSVLR